MKLDGKLKTVRRVVCELAAGGALPDGVKVDACPDDPLCVRADHLEIKGAVVVVHDRARKGSGSVSEVRPGVFKLSVVAGRHSDGTVRRAFHTFSALARKRHGRSPTLLPRWATARRFPGRRRG